MAELAKRVLPNGMTIEWTDLSFQEATQARPPSWCSRSRFCLPFWCWRRSTRVGAAARSDPDRSDVYALALAGVKFYGSDNNTFVQVGLVVLMGLACKNAILIVEFARELEFNGKGIVEAALEACRLRLRPIVMTSWPLSPARSRWCSRKARR